MNFKIKHEVFYQKYAIAVLFTVKNTHLCTIPLLVTDLNITISFAISQT